MDVAIDFLTGSIKDDLPYVETVRHDPPVEELPAVDVAALFPQVLAHRDVCSRAPLYQRYDGVVRGTTVLARGAADAGVLAPIPGSRLGVALAVAGNPRYGRIDARKAGEHAVLEAVRRVVAVGARPIGLTDCLNFGNPRKPEQFGDFVAAIDGLGTAARELGLAFVSGNVSLYNESKSGVAVPASPIVACVGAFADVGNVVTPGLKRADSALLWIGSRELSLGGSVLAELLGDRRAAAGDLLQGGAQRRWRFWRGAIARGVLLSCRAIADGGMLDRARAAGVRRDACAGRRVGAEIDFGNPLCEAGGFVSKSATPREIDMTGTLRVGTTTDEPVLAVNGTRFDVGRSSKRGRRRCGSSIRERAHRGARLSGHELRRRNAALAARLRRRRGARPLDARRDAGAVTMPTCCPGGFAYEDRVRAGAIAAHDRMMDAVIDGARREARARASATARRSCWKPDSCRAPAARAGRPPRSRPTVRQPHFICRHVYVKLAIEPSRCPITAALAAGAVIPGMGRARRGPPGGDAGASARNRRRRITSHSSTRKRTARSMRPRFQTDRRSARPGSSTRRQRARDHAASRARRLELQSPRPPRTGDDILAPSGGAVLFSQLRRSGERDERAHDRDSTEDSDNEAYTALDRAARLGRRGRAPRTQ